MVFKKISKFCIRAMLIKKVLGYFLTLGVV